MDSSRFALGNLLADLLECSISGWWIYGRKSDRWRAFFRLWGYSQCSAIKERLIKCKLLLGGGCLLKEDEDLSSLVNLLKQ